MLESGTENSEIDDADWTPAKATLDRFGKSESLKLASLLGSLSHPGIVMVISRRAGRPFATGRFLYLTTISARIGFAPHPKRGGEHG